MSTDTTTSDMTAPNVTASDVTTAELERVEAVTPPRTRGAAIIWGALFAAVAASGLWLLADGDRRSAATDWALSLTPNMMSTLAILTVGVLLLVAGAVGLLRRAQRRMSARAAHRPASASASPSASD